MRGHVASCLLLAAGLLAACEQGAEPGAGAGAGEAWAGADLNAFEALPALGDLDLARLRPREPIAYVEMRRRFGGGAAEVLSSAGVKCDGAADRGACVARFDALSTDVGFNRACLPASCYSYLAVSRGDEVFTAGSDEELRALFGDIDTREEALILVSAAGYHWQAKGDVALGAIRDAEGGYDVIARRFTRTCAPIIEQRALLFVAEGGEVRVQRAEVISYLPDACI